MSLLRTGSVRATGQTALRRATVGEVEVMCIEGVPKLYGVSAIDPSNMIAAALFEDRILRIGSDGSLKILFKAVRLNQPHAAVPVGPDSYLLTEYAGARVRLVDTTGATRVDYGASLPDGLSFIGPATAYPLDTGHIAVTDFKANRVLRFRLDGTFIDWLGLDRGGTGWHTACSPARPGAAQGAFDRPHATRTTEDGYLIVVDTWNHRLQRFDQDGTFAGWLGADPQTAPGSGWRTAGVSTQGTAPGAFNAPVAIDFDAAGDIYVADCYNSRVQRFQADGTYSGWLGGQEAGQPSTAWHKEDVPVTGDAPGAFRKPYDLAVHDGALIVADTHNKRLQHFSGSALEIAH